jgi:hypothetical protein
MSSSNKSILCGGCKCAVKTVANPKPHDKVTCPGCGRSDRFDKVMATIGEHVGHLTQKTMSEHLAKSTRGNRFVKFKPKHIPNRSFRWMIEGGL